MQRHALERAFQNFDRKSGASDVAIVDIAPGAKLKGAKNSARNPRKHNAWKCKRRKIVSRFLMKKRGRQPVTPGGPGVPIQDRGGRGRGDKKIWKKNAEKAPHRQTFL